ncbi:ATP-grasp domain-containing protein [Piscibacillus sp. B03]|uniref:ATP-grasp domain-containing protein n=1 Tax=Piscibacillus sp. B03 TaxID=3457430 RepID=UPI003FCCEDA6
MSKVGGNVMNGWLIYNGSLKIKKFELLTERLVAEANKKGIELTAIANNELFPTINSNGELDLNSLQPLTDPDFIIFWDKDVYLAEHLELMGYRLFNSKDAIERCDHKSLMHLQLAKQKVKTPKTIIGPFSFNEHEVSDDYADYVMEQLGEEVILKEAYGSFGMQVYKLTSKEELKQKMKDINGRDFILQEPIKTSFGRDLRVNIIGNEIVGAMQREFELDFRANITLGGQGTLTTLTPEQEELALQAHRALGLDFSGVDLLFGEQDEPIVCEVNSNVNYLSFEDISGVNFGSLLLDYIIGDIS